VKGNQQDELFALPLPPFATPTLSSSKAASAPKAGKIVLLPPGTQPPSKVSAVAFFITPERDEVGSKQSLPCSLWL